MSEVTKLKILFFLKFCAEAMFLPFLALYYKNLGFNTAAIGVFLAIPPIVGISLSPIYSIICRNIKVTKIIYMVITILNAICMFIFFQVKDYYALIVLIILINMFQANNFGVLEAFSSVCANHNKTDYSKVRVYGSIAYVFGLSLSGFIARFSSFYVASLVAIAFTLASAIITIFLNVTNEEKHEKRNVKALIRNKKYWLFTLFFMVFFGTLNVGDDFTSTYMETTKNMSVDAIGYIFSVYVIVECAVIIFLARFKKKFKFLHLYTIATVAIILRYMIFALGAPAPVIMAAGLLKGITWGIHAYLWGQYIVHITGKHNGTLAIIVEVFIVNVYQAIFKILMGHVIDKTSYYVFYLILALIEILILIFFIIIYRNDDYRSMPNKKRKRRVKKVEETKEEDIKIEEKSKEELVPTNLETQEAV